MSVHLTCNGCGRGLVDRSSEMPRRYAGEGRPDVAVMAVRGERCDGMGGGGMPNGEFHLCPPCAGRMWAAVMSGPPQAKAPRVMMTAPVHHGAVVDIGAGSPPGQSPPG